MLKIPAEPEADAATVSVEVEESLSREVLDWCGARSITSEQLVRVFIQKGEKMTEFTRTRYIQTRLPNI